MRRGNLNRDVKNKKTIVLARAGKSMPDSKQQTQTSEREESSVFQEPIERQPGSHASSLSGATGCLPPARHSSCLRALPHPSLENEKPISHSPDVKNKSRLGAPSTAPGVESTSRSIC